ncbi:LLM class F420-dependent oxidoreductase [Actinomycetospora sp. CA-101289]|uniref:LLM class F420-dependent oxidoreductase n=1 Tax=Actinomycetospora sp. CA-101289 TaxID=3239893 RepID=UPI003D97B4AF
MTMDLGRYGIWQRAGQLDPELARAVESLGFGTIWIGGSPPGDLALAESLLGATENLVIATGIVNMWSTPADEVAASYHRLEAKHPGRFLLGVGVSHPEANRDYQKPYATIVEYLDALDAADVPADRRILAALGPKVLGLSAQRTAGAHPYLVPPEHTRRAREILGDAALLAPENKVVLNPDPATARDIGRPAVQKPYLGLRNYVSNLERLGWTDHDIADGGSDALIDALVAHGEPESVATRLDEHLAAGADHVCAQILTAEGDDLLPHLRRLAGALGLS